MDKTQKIIVFLGPTLSIKIAKDILDATYLPPIKRGDIFNAIQRYNPAIIAIIDGCFNQTLSVWHSEIMFALESGIPVFGSSSMGALRAAELSSFGMKGIGKVFDLYSSNKIEDDDEVALLHADHTHQYKQLSFPMINLRKTFELALKKKTISQSEHDLLLKICKNIFYMNRNLSTILDQLRSSNFCKTKINEIKLLIENYYIDVKKKDAYLLLNTLGKIKSPISIKTKRYNSNVQALNESLANCEKKICTNNKFLNLRNLANFIAIEDSNFLDDNFNALNIQLALHLAKFLNLNITEKEILKEEYRFRNSHNLQDDNLFDQWLGSNDILLTDFKRFIKHISICRRLHRWLLNGPLSSSKSTCSILDYHRFKNTYIEWKSKFINLFKNQQISSEPYHYIPIQSFKSLIGKWRANKKTSYEISFDEWVFEAGFHDKKELFLELSKIYKDEKISLSVYEQPLFLNEVSPLKISSLFISNTFNFIESKCIKSILVSTILSQNINFQWDSIKTKRLFNIFYKYVLSIDQLNIYEYDIKHTILCHLVEFKSFFKNDKKNILNWSIKLSSHQECSNLINFLKCNSVNCKSITLIITIDLNQTFDFISLINEFSNLGILSISFSFSNILTKNNFITSNSCAISNLKSLIHWWFNNRNRIALNPFEDILKLIQKKQQNLLNKIDDFNIELNILDNLNIVFRHLKNCHFNTSNVVGNLQQISNFNNILNSSYFNNLYNYFPNNETKNHCIKKDLFFTNCDYVYTQLNLNSIGISQDSMTYFIENDLIVSLIVNYLYEKQT